MRNRATAQPGLTLEAYAAAKGLPVDFLRALGLRTTTYKGEAKVKIPYLDDNGNEIAVRYRHALDGSGRRFSWKTGSKAMLYGLDRLDAAQKEDYVVLVEGESDAQTLWLHNVPAVGI